MRRFKYVVAAVFSFAVAGCDNETYSPELTGTPEVALAQEAYFFSPQLSGTSSAFAFSAENLPAWADIDSADGTVSGIPGTSDVGLHEGIMIVATDGGTTLELGPLTIEVWSVGDRSVTVNWQPPSENEDGTVLSDLAGFTVRYGRSDTSFDSVVDVSNPGLTSFVVDGLVPGTYYFTTTAYNAAGSESEPSAIASGTIP